MCIADVHIGASIAMRCIRTRTLAAGIFIVRFYAKTNIAAVLKSELTRFSGETVNLGGVTDSYQPAEREYKLMRGVLELLAEYRVPVTVCTKSPLILRDIDLLKKVGSASAVKTAFTITTLDDTTAKLIEPNAPPPSARMDAVRTLRESGISCGVHLMPIVPYLTSGQSDLEAVFCAAKEVDAAIY